MLSVWVLVCVTIFCECMCVCACASVLLCMEKKKDPEDELCKGPEQSGTTAQACVTTGSL